jgi:EmrB/QacA subfamily drug resistance transporter
MKTSAGRNVVVLAILMATFMAAMEATVIGTAMPTVVADLGGLELYGWVGAVYMLTMTVTMPVYGKLADVIGRKPVMLVGIAIFLAGSAASGLARTMPILIVMRAVQGVGAGGIQPIAMTILGDLYTPSERARVQALFGAVWGVSGIAGPLLGGVIVHALSWRWVFYVNVPFGALTTVLLLVGHREPAREASKRPPLDLLGAVTLTLAVLLLLGGARGKPVLLAGAAVSLAAFVAAERRHPSPMLPLDLMRRRLIAVSSLCGALLGATMSAIVLYVPLYVQAILLRSATVAGATVAPMLVGWPIASALSGRLLLRTGPRPLVRIGLAIVAVAAVAIDRAISGNASALVLQVAMFAVGIGMGLANTALLIAVQESVGFTQRGVATASTMFFRTIGGALAVGVLGSILGSVLNGRVPEEVLDALLGPEHGRDLAPDVVRTIGAVLGEGMTTVFHVITAMAVLGVIGGVFFPAVALGERQESAKSTTTGP